ncbi:MAG: ATP-binding protein [Candidatus Aadella gelida]|nr:ATP-binding protein [Candidatus Aadella gelida]
MRKITKLGTKINSKIGKAINDHNLIKDGDSLLVAVSGGKDSLTALYFLKQIQKWAPIEFDIKAIHVITDMRCGDELVKERLTHVFEQTDTEYYFKKTKVLDENGHTSCFWCSWNRRKILFETAEELGCRKIVLGHHKDDIAETILMNLLYRGEISGMNPHQELFNGKLALIRPLCYVEEAMIIKFAQEQEFLSQKNQCPFGKIAERQYIKELIKNIGERVPGTNVRTNIVNSLKRVKEDYISV